MWAMTGDSTIAASPLGMRYIRHAKRDAIAPSPSSANAVRAHNEQQQLHSRLVYENNHSAFYIISRNTQLRCFSFASITSLNEISLATFRRRASWANELEFISDASPAWIPLLASTRLDCDPQSRCVIAPRQFLAQGRFASPLPSPSSTSMARTKQIKRRSGGPVTPRATKTTPRRTGAKTAPGSSSHSGKRLVYTKQARRTQRTSPPPSYSLILGFRDSR
jgi:hypothetical protein